jgi:hypothetical protein
MLKKLFGNYTSINPTEMLTGNGGGLEYTEQLYFFCSYEYEYEYGVHAQATLALRPFSDYCASHLFHS